MSPDELSDRLLNFAVTIGKVVDALPETRLGRHVAMQLVRSGVSAGPNYEEACDGESRGDFRYRIKVVLKELRESRYWLRLIAKADLVPASKMNGVTEECTQLCNIIGRSVLAAKGIKQKKDEASDNASEAEPEKPS